MQEIENLPDDFAPLSWYRGDDSVFSAKAVGQESDNSRFAKRGRRSAQEAVTILDLLRQHFRSDKSKLWTWLAQWEKAYNNYSEARELLQRKVMAVLKEKTEYEVDDDKKQITPPLIYSNTAGYWLYKSSLESTSIQRHSYLNEDDIFADTQRGVVMYHNSILAEAPGAVEETKQNILAAYSDILKSEELKGVVNSTRNLKKAEEKVKPVIESVLLLGFILGRCSVCQRLGL